MHRPTRKSNILDLFFCPSELINAIVASDTFISDHRMIFVETNIPDMTMTKFILKIKTSFEAYKRYIYVQLI